MFAAPASVMRTYIFSLRVVVGAQARPWLKQILGGMPPPGEVKGGSRQRMRRLAQGPAPTFANAAAEVAGSHLVALLLSRIAWGELSAAACQQIADAAVRDGLNHPVVKKMAAAGSHGKFPNNCNRDIKKCWPDMFLSAGVTMLAVPMVLKKGAMDVIEEAIFFCCTCVGHKRAILVTCSTRAPPIASSPISHLAAWHLLICHMALSFQNV